ncbi:MAG: stress response translation initiation inhibitor YciH [Candidatus Omnitrophica bacterium]|nr:stress response translation initiation inhibitor YciH [Candidatus Omnitrophota bacterium]
MKNNTLNSRLVYSTEVGSVCLECAQPVNNCVCQKIKKAVVPKGDGVVRVAYEIKGRRGKGVTVISGLPLSETGLLDLARELKHGFGTGGSVKDHIVELQGDFRKQATQELRKMGFLK